MVTMSLKTYCRENKEVNSNCRKQEQEYYEKQGCDKQLPNIQSHRVYSTSQWVVFPTSKNSPQRADGNNTNLSQPAIMSYGNQEKKEMPAHTSANISKVTADELFWKQRLFTYFNNKVVQEFQIFKA